MIQLKIELKYGSKIQLTLDTYEEVKDYLKDFAQSHDIFAYDIKYMDNAPDRTELDTFFDKLGRETDLYIQSYSDSNWDLINAYEETHNIQFKYKA